MDKVIKFGAAWCGPCRAMKPQFDKFQEDVKELNVEVLDVDIDKNYEYSEKYGVRSIPLTLFIKNGEVAESIKGYVTADKLLNLYKDVYK
jgi:thioredoxin 1